MTWNDDYERNKKSLTSVTPEDLAGQMKKLEKEAPAMAAVVNFLALSLADQINGLDQHQDENAEQPNILRVIPIPVVNFALTTALIPDMQRLCDQLNKWAAVQHFRKLREGVLEEPGHYCD